MNVNPLTGALVSTAASSTQRTNARILQAVSSIASGNRLTSASADVASLSVAAQLQERVGAFRQVGFNLLQAGSQVQVADQGLSQQSAIVDRLTQLATQANSGALDNDGRKALNIEFKSLSQELTRISQQTRFGSNNLLDGSFKFSLDQSLGEEASAESTQLEIPDTSASALFGGDLDISTQDGAKAALSALKTASDTLTGIRAEVGSTGQSIDYASASVESALFNQQAALSQLSDTDFTEAAINLSQGILQQNFEIATQVQAKRLPPSMLELIGN